jgi:RHS repeat-associated protein
VGAALPVILQETAGAQTTYYVYGLDLIASIQGSTPTYYLYDGLGSTTQLANGGGSVTGTYTYDAFGSVRAHTGASTQWSFTGEQNDPNGLEYLRARYYDPAVGRFLSRDPLAGLVGVPQSLNRYAYVLNNPMRWVDPWGLHNVEGTPTPTPPAYNRVCGPVRAGGVCENPHFLVPSSGQRINWADFLSSVKRFLTSRSPQCFTTASLSAGAGTLTIVQPETAPWSFPTFLALVEPAVTSCLAD